MAHKFRPRRPRRRNGSQMAKSPIQEQRKDSIEQIVKKIDQMVWLLREERRIKKDVDYAILSKYGEVHVLCNKVWASTINEIAEKVELEIQISLTKDTKKKEIYESCFCCGRELKHDYWDSPSIGMLNDGLIFRSNGNFGSTIFDPIDSRDIEIYICDKCVVERLDKSSFIVQSHNSGLEYRGKCPDDGEKVVFNDGRVDLAHGPSRSLSQNAEETFAAQDFIKKAKEFATNAHMDQKRKYGDRPYICHPEAVYNYLMRKGYRNKDLLAAGMLHDVKEDCKVTYEELKITFNDNVAALVNEVSKPAAFGSRQERWQICLDHYKQASDYGKILKLADRINNLQDFLDHWDDLPDDEKSFVKEVYVSESEDLSLTIGDVDEEIKSEMIATIKSIKNLPE